MDKTINLLYSNIAGRMLRQNEVYETRRERGWNDDDHPVLAISCAKYGYDFFRVPPEHEEEDWDWPDFVGRKIVDGIIDQAFNYYNLYRSDFNVEVDSGEKAWIYIYITRK